VKEKMRCCDDLLERWAGATARGGGPVLVRDADGNVLRVTASDKFATLETGRQPRSSFLVSILLDRWRRDLGFDFRPRAEYANTVVVGRSLRAKSVEDG
jgi:hypothetical protein